MAEAKAEGDEAAMMIKTKSRKEKRKEKKKIKRKQERRERAEMEREEEERRMNDPEEQRRAKEMEEEERERMEKERKEFEERERKLLEEIALKRRIKEQEEEEERKKKLLEEEEEEEEKKKDSKCNEEKKEEDDDDWEYVEEGPAEIIWQGNEIIVRKKKVRVPKNRSTAQRKREEDAERPISNPLPPQSEAFLEHKKGSTRPVQDMLENVAQQVPNFGTEQDKAHCPFHLKTGACRFGLQCSRVHFYPDKACTLLMKNMYNGPGLAWEQDEGLEYTDDEVERCYEEFYEDVHTEFLKYGEIVNFKVCKNGSFHLRGNVYVHYKSLDSAVLAYQSINGRFFAGKQVKCEFVNLTRWKVAICGEYLKSRLKTCSHGTACNFLHCFRNPGGDYEWADWDKPPPRYWVRKMAALFGYSDVSVYEKEGEEETLAQQRTSSKRMLMDTDRHRAARSRSRDFIRSSHKISDKEDNIRQQRHLQRDQKLIKNFNEKLWDDYAHTKDRYHRKGRSYDNSEGGPSDGDRDSDMETYTRNPHSRKRSKHGEVPECSTSSGAGKNRVDDFEVDSNEELSDGGRSRPLHDRTKSLGRWAKEEFSDDDRDYKKTRHGNLRSNPRDHQNIRSLHDLQNSKDGTCDSGSSGLQSRGREGDRHHHQRRLSSGYRKDVSESPDHWEDDRYRTLGNDSSDDQFDRDKERHHGHRRKRSRHSRQEFSDNERSNKKRSREQRHGRNSEIEKSHLEVSRKGSSSGRSSSIKESNGADYVESLGPKKNHGSDFGDQHYKKQESNDRNSRYSSIEEDDEQDRWKPESFEIDLEV